MPSKIKTVLYIILQLSWGLPQTLVGAAVFIFLARREHFVYNGCTATVWKNRSSASLGLFIFISENLSGDLKTQIIKHEYGHTLQSLILGPLYLPVISLPSMLWCMLPVFGRLREKRGISYYSLYTESWANKLGDAKL